MFGSELKSGIVEAKVVLAPSCSKVAKGTRIQARKKKRGCLALFSLTNRADSRIPHHHIHSCYYYDPLTGFCSPRSAVIEHVVPACLSRPAKVGSMKD